MAFHTDGQALARVLIQQGQHFKLAAGVGVIKNEIPGPHMMSMLGLVGRAAPRDFFRLGLHLAFLTPTDALHLLVADRPPFFGQGATNPPIAIARIRPGRRDNPLVALLLSIWHGLGRIPIR